MKGGRLTRASVAALLLVCLTGLVASAASAPPGFSIDNDSGPEGGNADFTVTLAEAAPAGGIELTYSTANGTASAGDYTGVPNGTLSFAEGDTTKPISIDLAQDARDEDNETLSVTVKHAEGGDQTGTGTIIDDDDPPSTTGISDVTVTEGDSGTLAANFTVGLSGPSGKPITIRYSTADGSAVEPGDYTAEISQDITIAPGSASGTISIAVKGDTLPESTENFFVNLLSGTNVTIAGDTQGRATITDNDVAPTASINDATVTEGNTGTVNATFTVTLSAAAPAPVQVRYSTVNGSAVSPDDYVGVTNATLNIAQGATTGQFNIQVKGDTFPEGTGDPRAEDFFVDLISATGATIGSDSRGRGQINDDDTPPTVQSISDPTVTEGNTGEVDARFVVTLSANAPTAVAVRYSTTDGSATAPADYTAASGATLNIAAGQSTGTITIKVKGDTLPEGSGDPRSENFFVDLLSATGATLGSDTRGTGTITDDDAQRTLTIVAAQVTEGTGGTATLDFKVRLSGTTSLRVEVTATTADGSAVAPADYQAKTQALVWAPNTPADQLEKTFSVVVIGDSLDEIDETMVVRLEGAQNASVAVAQVNGTIRDNDHFSQLSISDTEANEGSGGTTSTMTFKVTLSPASARPVHVAYATANGTGTAGSDYTATSGSVSFAPGETSKDIAVAILGDDVTEPNETVLVNLSGAAGASAADAQGQGTIVDKNAPPSLSIDDPLAREGEGATFTVTLAGTTLQEVRVTFSTGDGTAKEGNDYSARRSTLVFAPGEKTKNVAITVLDDALPEQAETFTVNLADPVNAAITKKTGTATIEASDLSTATPQGGGTPPTNRPITPLPVPKPPNTKKNVIYPKMVLGPRVVTVVGGRARMLVTCVKASPMICAGAVALETTTKPKVKLGQKAFKVKKGKKAFVSIVLSTKARKLVQKTGTLKVRAVVFVKTSKATVRVVPGVITIKVAKKTTSSSSTP